MNPEETLVSVRDLTKSFGDGNALDHVNLDFGRGRVIGLLGANGAGKSTLLRHIIGLYLPDDGECVTLGCKARDLGPSELARMGYVHQDGELLDWMTVRQHIRYVAAFYDTWNLELEERFVADFELPLEKRVGSLSPGQKQRLAILIAIGHEPELLLLDEPAAALDPLARIRFLDLIMHMIQDARRTIVISSHILSDVEKVIDHAIIMDKGRILRDCPIDELREEYSRLRLTALRRDLPEQLPFDNVCECRREASEALLVVRRAAPTTLEAAERTLQCQIQSEGLSLEDIYRFVVAEQNGEVHAR